MNSGYATWPLSDIAEHHAAPTVDKKTKQKQGHKLVLTNVQTVKKACRTLL